MGKKKPKKIKRWGKDAHGGWHFNFVTPLSGDEVPPDLLRAMDREEITFPHEFIAKLAQHGLRGLRFPRKWGGREYFIEKIQ